MLKKEMMSITKDEMNNGMRTFKAAMLYTHEYGQAAYQTWLANEAEITKLAKTGKVLAEQIYKLRERNFRQMKAAGAKRAASRPVQAGTVRHAA